MTKSGKNMDKLTTSPMFPRLSLNDTEKGTRKAPPRNKMALYEQLSMPSQKLILPTLNGSHLVPSNSSNHDSCHEKLSSFSFNAIDFSMPTDADMLQHKSIKPTNLSASNGSTSLSSNANHDSSKKYNVHNFENTLGKDRMGGADDLRVPLFSTIQRSFDKRKLTNLTSILPFQWQPTIDKDTNQGSVGADLNYSIEPMTPHLNREIRSPARHNTTRLSHESAATPKENIASYGIDGGHDDDHHHWSFNGNKKRGKSCEDWEIETSQKLDGKNDNGGVSETSMVDCCLNISPDDVVGVIGEKHFWRARTVLSRHQMIFAEQLFELHRLIKVQKKFVASPNLLLEDNFNVYKPSLHSAPLTRKLRPDYVLQPSDQITGTKDQSRELISTTNNHSDNAVAKIPLPSFNKQFVTTPLSNHGLTPPWCYNPPPPLPINQWLIPIMSPSQGLVYKPYTGPFPPSTGFMPPVYGNCRPVTLPSKDYFDGFNQSCYPPHVTPIMNPLVSNSAFDQTSIFSESRVNEDFNFASTYTTNKNIEADEKCTSSKQSELLGSTESSSPSETEQCNAMPLFPMEPTLRVEKETPVESSSTKEQTRVIKVIPHNPQVATETAARIFKSIQAERENCK